jgi:hypothetical protein
MDIHGVDITATYKVIKETIKNRIQNEINFINKNEEISPTTFNNFWKNNNQTITGRTIRSKVSWPNETEAIQFIMYGGTAAITGGWNDDEMCLIKSTLNGETTGKKVSAEENEKVEMFHIESNEKLHSSSSSSHYIIHEAMQYNVTSYSTENHYQSNGCSTVINGKLIST